MYFLDHVHTKSDSFLFRHKNLSDIIWTPFGMIRHERIFLQEQDCMPGSKKKNGNRKQPKQAADYKEANKDIFSWSNNEIQLVLMAALDF